MAEICWFCKKNESDPGTMAEVHLHKEIKRDMHLDFQPGQTITKTNIQFLPEKVLIPRCSKCEKIQSKAVKVNKVLGTIGIVGLLLMVLLAYIDDFQFIYFAICGVPTTIILVLAFLIPKYYLRSSGTISDLEGNKHPEVLSLLGSGYEIGKWGN